MAAQLQHELAESKRLVFLVFVRSKCLCTASPAIGEEKACVKPNAQRIKYSKQVFEKIRQASLLRAILLGLALVRGNASSCFCLHCCVA